MPALLVGGEGSEPLWTAPDPFPGTKIILSLQLPLQLFTEKQKSPPQYKPVPRNSHSLIAWAKKVGRKPTVGKDLYCQGKLSLHKWDRTEQVCKAHFTWTTWHRKHKDWKEKYSFHFSCCKTQAGLKLEVCSLGLPGARTTGTHHHAQSLEAQCYSRREVLWVAWGPSMLRMVFLTQAQLYRKCNTKLVLYIKLKIPQVGLWKMGGHHYFYFYLAVHPTYSHCTRHTSQLGELGAHFWLLP